MDDGREEADVLEAEIEILERRSVTAITLTPDEVFRDRALLVGPYPKVAEWAPSGFTFGLRTSPSFVISGAQTIEVGPINPHAFALFGAAVIDADGRTYEVAPARGPRLTRPTHPRGPRPGRF